MSLGIHGSILLLLCGVLLIAGCRTTEPAPVAPNSTPTSMPASQTVAAPAPGSTCAQQTMALLGWFDKLMHDVSPLALLSSQLELVERQAQPVRSKGPLLELVYRKQPDLAGIGLRLDDVLRYQRRAADNAGEVQLYVAVDRRASWSVVAYLAHVAQKKKLQRIGFLFWSRETAPPPPRSSLDPVVRQLLEKYNRMVHPSEPAVLLGSLEAAKPHPAIARLFAHCPKVQLALRLRHQRVELRRELERQLRACRCKIELPALQAWLRFQLLMVSRRGPKSMLVVQLARPGSGAPQLELASERPWQNAVLDLQRAVDRAGGTPLRLLAK